MVSEFTSKKNNNTLENYIRDADKAWADDLEGETRVYLVKDESGTVALFFSIKCGLLVGDNLEERLSEEKQEFVETVIEAKKAKDEKSLDNMYEAGLGMYDLEECDRLFNIASRRLERKQESKEIGQSESTINVQNCISAIELRHLCKNEKYYLPKDVTIPLGFGIFWEVIVPTVIDITKKIGCKYLYLYAADKTEQKDTIEVKKLISHYKSNFKFSECDEGIKFIKPEYDNYCDGLVQLISELQNNREAIWHEFSDI